jgi:hypothetical protein
LNLTAGVFKSKEFARFARKAGIADLTLCQAIVEIHAGLVDADLGGGVFKQRVRRAGEGKSGGFRTIILLRLHEIAIFIFGFSKSERASISSEELAVYKHIAKGLLADKAAVSAAVEEGKLIEVSCDETSKIPQ